MPIATSLCPDEVDHHADDPEDDADADADGGDADDEDILPWSSSVYFLVHFPQKQDINQLKWQAMKFVERGGTTRRNSGRVHLFKITLPVISLQASHICSIGVI